MDILEFTGKIGISLVLAGHLSVKVNGHGHTLDRGEFLIVTPLFVYEEFEESDDLRVANLRIDIHSFFERMKKHLRMSFMLYIFNHPVHRVDEADFEYLEFNIGAISRQRQRCEDSQIQEPLREILVDSVAHNTDSLLMSVIASTLYRHRDEIFNNRDDQKNTDSLVPQFMLSVNQNYKSQRTVEFYARQANMSTGYFSSLIRQKTGRSPMHWITFIIINNAKILLKHKDLSIKEIARELGFPEQFTFRKYFKHHTGLSPTDFRKANTNDRNV